jgi:fructose-bisphosphate aldolase class II
MPLVTTGELLSLASRASSGVAAFNVITLEYAEAIVLGAERARCPVILQVSQNAVAFHDGRVEPIARAAAERAEQAAVPISLHLDHVEDEALLRRAGEAGFSSVMFDASRLPYDENVERTRAAAQWAHAHGLCLEAELGEVGGKKGAHAPGSRTDPDEARAFVAATGVDALAVAVGSSHAMVEQSASLDHELIARLRAAVDVPLVLHGSSGVPAPALRQAVEAGMVKINIGTALSIAFTRAVRDQLDSAPDAVDPRACLTAAKRAVAEVVAGLATVISPALADLPG